MKGNSRFQIPTGGRLAAASKKKRGWGSKGPFLIEYESALLLHGERERRPVVVSFVFEASCGDFLKPGRKLQLWPRRGRISRPISPFSLSLKDASTTLTFKRGGFSLSLSQTHDMVVQFRVSPSFPSPPSHRPRPRLKRLLSWRGRVAWRGVAWRGVVAEKE